jgi:hypothetical protein
MKKIISSIIVLSFLSLTMLNPAPIKTATITYQEDYLAGARTEPLIINYTCTNLSEIPAEWLEKAKDLKWHYAHTSHGSQLTTGLTRLEAMNDTYSVAIAHSLPDENNTLDILDGQPGYEGYSTETYITPDLYWESEEGINRTKLVLTYNDVNASAWSWCTQLTYYSEVQVQDYLDTMTQLEIEFPDVTFIYMTCNAQASGSSGYNRYQRNEQIRNYCIANNKVLFDFADLDSWYNGEQNTYSYNNATVPLEHPHFNGNEAGHTTYESCEQKGRAVWWLMGCLAGWNAPQGNITIIPTTTPTNFLGYHYGTTLGIISVLFAIVVVRSKKK